MDFLDGSQTFLGTLLTLNVLCIFADSNNNFILKILSDLSTSLKKELKELESLIANDRESIRKSENFKIIEKISRSKEDYPQYIVEEADMLSYRYSVTSEAASIALNRGCTQHAQIEKSNEQFCAPFFTLLFGLTMFVVDELCRFGNSNIICEAYLFYSWIMTIAAILYWAILWIAFMFSSYPLKQRKKGYFWFYVDSKTTAVDSTFLQLIVFSIIYYLGLYLCFSAVSIGWLHTVLLLVTAVSPLLIVGVWRETGCSVIGRYSLQHIYGHFAIFLTYAFIITVITLGFFNSSLQSLPLFSNISLLRLFIIAFVLTNGLLLPFILPYYKYHRSYDIASGELKSEHTKVLKAKITFEADFGEFCKKLGIANISSILLSSPSLNISSKADVSSEV